MRKSEFFPLEYSAANYMNDFENSSFEDDIEEEYDDDFDEETELRSVFPKIKFQQKIISKIENREEHFQD